MALVNITLLSNSVIEHFIYFQTLATIMKTDTCNSTQSWVSAYANLLLVRFVFFILFNYSLNQTMIVDQVNDFLQIQSFLRFSMLHMLPASTSTILVHQLLDEKSTLYISGLHCLYFIPNITRHVCSQIMTLFKKIALFFKLIIVMFFNMKRHLKNAFLTSDPYIC